MHVMKYVQFFLLLLFKTLVRIAFVIETFPNRYLFAMKWRQFEHNLSLTTLINNIAIYFECRRIPHKKVPSKKAILRGMD